MSVAESEGAASQGAFRRGWCGWHRWVEGSTQVKRAELELTQANIPFSGGDRADPARGPTVGNAPSTTTCSARDALHRRFVDRLVVRDDLSRRVVSYQANKAMPGLRWVKYKEGFSAELVRDALRVADGPVLDPFAGIGTTALVAGGSDRRATAFEIMPVGARTAAAIS